MTSPSTDSSTSWFDRPRAIVRWVLQTLARVPPGRRWMLAFVPGLIIMLAAIPLGMTHWGSEYVQVNDDTHSTNAGQFLEFGAIVFFLFGPAGAGVIAVASNALRARPTSHAT